MFCYRSTYMVHLVPKMVSVVRGGRCFLIFLFKEKHKKGLLHRSSLLIPGYDNSGHRGNADWATQQSNIDRTKAIIQSIAQEFSDPQYYGVVTALAILNEPAGYLNSQLLDAARQFNSECVLTDQERKNSEDMFFLGR